MKKILSLSLFALSLSAQEASPASPLKRSTLIDVGAYTQSNSDGYGKWQGWVVDATYDPGKGGPWIASLVNFDRPEGHGTELTAGKYIELGWGYAFVGAGSSVGADYLPKWTVNADLNVALGQSGWVLGGGFTRSEVRDGHRDFLYQFGPTLYAGGWVFTARHLRNQSNPGGVESSAQLVDARHGTDDRKMWQSLQFAWGGEAYQSFAVRENVSTRGARASATAFFPIREHHGIKASLEWSQKDGIYRSWGASLRYVFLF
jgi:YaiO family outer membrane protein